MEHKLMQELPYSNITLVLAILSIVFSCLFPIGFMLGVIAYILAIKSSNLYKENPETYYSNSQIYAGKIIAIIGMLLNFLSFLLVILVITGIREIIDEFISSFSVF